MKLLLTITLLFNFVYADITQKEFTQLKKSYISDFKDKYEKRYEKKLQRFPKQLQELLLATYKKALTYMKNPTINQKHKLVKGLYQFFDNYQKQNGKAEYFAKKIAKDIPELKNTPLLKQLIQYGKESDNVIKEEIKRDKEEIKRDKEEIKRDKEEIKRWEKLMGKLNSL